MESFKNNATREQRYLHPNPYPRLPFHDADPGDKLKDNLQNRQAIQRFSNNFQLFDFLNTYRYCPINKTRNHIIKTPPIMVQKMIIAIENPELDCTIIW